MKQEYKQIAIGLKKNLSKIPNTKWAIGTFHAGNDRHCVLGHCISTPAVRSVFDSNLSKYDIFAVMEDILGRPAAINDGHVKKYKQKSPKSRVLTALNDVLNKHVSTEQRIIDLNGLIARSHGARKLSYIRSRAGLKAAIKRSS